MSVINDGNAPAQPKNDRRLMAYLLLVTAYIVSGKLGLMLALPPGYASPIFPPAGIAVAAALIGGRRTLPWIFLGSLLLNIWVGYSASHHIDTTGFIAAAIIAAASMLQAAIGGWLLRRTIGYPVSIDCGRDVLRFLLLAPVICLTSASLSVRGLAALGLIDTAGFAANWAVWWVGDTLGVVVMLPLVMIAAGEPRALWKSRTRTVAVPMLLIFTLFVVIFIKANKWESDDSLKEFRQTSRQVVNQVQTRFEMLEFLLEQTAGLLTHDTSGHITREEFHRFTEKSLVRFPMIQALEWAPHVGTTHRASFEMAQRNSLPDFEIREKNTAGSFQRAGERAQFYPITYVEPLNGNEPAVGFDLASTPDRRAALAKAVESGMAVATPPIHLLQDHAGILLLLPVNAGSSESGAVLTVLRMDDFMGKLLLATRSMLYVRFIDVDEHKILYDSFAPEVKEALFEQSFGFGTRHYQLQTSPTPAYLMQHRGWQSWGVLTMGILGTGLLGALLLLGTGYAARVEAQVEERTKKLKESKANLNAMLDNSPYLVWLKDTDGRFIKVNQPFFKTTGLKQIQDVLGKTDFDLWPKELAKKYRADDAEVMSTRQQKLAEEMSIMENGEVQWVETFKSPILDEKGRLLGTTGFAQNITMRKNAEDRIRHLANYDMLTDLPNRTLLSDRIQQALATARRDKARMALMFIDFDEFKPINDTLGHNVGDLLLKEAAQRMQDCVRESDTVARFGGDEFVVLLPTIEAEQDAMVVAEKIRLTLCQPFHLAGHSLHISSSIGVAVYPEHGSGEEMLLKSADTAMYCAKGSGRNNVKLFPAVKPDE